MITPDQVKPFLTHEDRYVRRAAVKYFVDSASHDPEVLPKILDAIEAHSDDSLPFPLVYGEPLAMTGEVLDRLLALLAQADDPEKVSFYQQILAWTPGDLVGGHESAFRGHDKIPPEVLRRLELRRELTDWTSERLWEALQERARRFDLADSDDDVDSYDAEDLRDALATRNLPDDETLCRLLRELEPQEGWLEIYLTDLAGQRRVAQAVPALVAKYHLDADFLLERVNVALARIGDPEAVRLIRDAYPTASFDFKCYATTPLGTIKSPESEAAILALLETENDRTSRTMLCMNLCDLFSERAVEVVRAEVARGYDRSYTSLETDVLPVARALGIDFPEAETWARARLAEERRLARRFAEMAKIDRFLLAPSEPNPAGHTPDAFPAVAVDTIRRASPKVGRNDPCPCGSGKKWKKCCGVGH